VKLESLGQAGATDRRVRQAIVTPKGKAMTDAVNDDGPGDPASIS
jgi:hypothetical protein